MSLDRTAFFIGNQWVKPSTHKVFEIINASTGERIATVPEGVEADIDAAVAAARTAFDNSGWPQLSPAERAKVMLKFMEAMARRGPQLAQAVSMQNGMPVSLSNMLEAQFPAGLLQYYASLADGLSLSESRPSQMGKETLVEKSAIGVVGAIVPWNFPATLAFSKIAPAMLAGCTLVVKPSPGTVLDSYLVAEAALEAGVPPGVINIVAADRAAGAHLVSHPEVDKIAFTGSTAAGRKIASVCGELLRPVTLELGGKSAAVLLEDVDLNVFLPGIPMASMLNNGQACYNATRILAPAKRYNEIVDAVAGMVSTLVIGDAMDAGTHVGPMASALHRDRVEGYIAKGKEEARLVAGGGRPSGHNRGWFVEPTVFADVNNGAVIAQEEIFGPVLSIIKYQDEDEAVRIANDSIFGLGGSVWSSDSAHATDVARRVDSGTVGVNGYMPSLGSPFGGVKGSGMGSEFGPEAVNGYMQTKSIYVMG
ncbi:aldehyde dehydrogenase [Sphingorhabdus sp.]|uniref:aldehyde dehydrogenase n=1 Tax=Sphingorhabdus sp. TaxID=1902408 RepID=UPI0038FCA6DB